MRILVVSNQRPHPPIAGGRQRTYLLIQALRELGRVDLFLLDDRKNVVDEDWKFLEREFNLVGAARLKGIGERGIWRLMRPFRPALVDRVARELVSYDCSYCPQTPVAEELQKAVRLGRYDVIIGRYLLPTVQCGAFGLGLPVVVDIDDLETQICRDRLTSPEVSRWRRIALSTVLRCLEANVPQWLSKAKHLWLSCPSDITSVHHHSTSLLPNVPFFERSRSSFEVKLGGEKLQSVLVVGHLGWPANIRGISWFIKFAWPIILEAGVPVELRIVGASLHPRLAKRWQKTSSVRLVGYVEDVAVEYQGASVVIAPLIDGGGTKIKVLEALQHHCATVVTPQALRGYENAIKDGEAVLVADNAAQFAANIIGLLQNKDLRRRLGQAGAAIVDSHFSRAAFKASVRETFKQLSSTESHSSV